MPQQRNVLHEILGKQPHRRPPQGPTGRQITLGIVILLLLVAGFTSFYTVQPEEEAVVKRFGAVYGITGPGLHFKLPFGIDSVQKVPTARVLKQEFGFRTVDASGERSRFNYENFLDESLMLSGDLNIIRVEWVVQYRISDPIKYLYAMREPTKTLRDLSESVMRRVVGNRIGSEVLTTGRVEIASEARNEIQEAMDRFDNGLHIITVELQDVVPPARVQPAYNEVNKARQEAEGMINDANRQRNEAVPRAEGTAERIIAEAQGYAAERVNRALGETARFNAVLAEYRNAPAVTRSRLYIETLRDVLPRVGSVVVMQEGQVLPLLNIDQTGLRQLSAVGDEPTRDQPAENALAEEDQ
ncbi:MAG TPA: FtsH protease activity modulator HflK [Woeseiaceae bacterium]|nr:FtsH protease activity modulator HflK [Woeseiaceae bacterium]